MVSISVIMPVYNGEKFLREAIDSILTQSFKDFELIIINDGSKDNSKLIIDSFDDERIIYVEQENKGLATALNHGISYSKGEFIARMDADDISMPYRLMKQYLFFRSHPQISVVSGSFSYIDNNGSYLGRSFAITNPFLVKKTLLNSGCIICHPSVMMRRKDFYSVNGYLEIMGNRFTDYHLWVKFIKNGFKIQNMSEILIKYRIIDTAISSKFTLSNDGRKILLKIIKKDNPTISDLSNLNNFYEPNDESFLEREKVYNNLQNYLYNKIPYLKQNIKNYIFSLFANILALIR